MPQTYSHFDLFSGAGGFSAGLIAAGFKSVGAVEKDVVAGNSYLQNFPETRIRLFGSTQGDLTKISPQHLAFLVGTEGIGELDLLVAGPPCQGFSRIGRGKLLSLNDREDALLNDPRNNLYQFAIASLQALRPRVFLFENVAGMLHIRGHNMVEAVCSAVSKCGYNVRCALLNSAWYGVPQTRERVFVIGFRNDLGITPRFPAIRHKIELSRGLLSSATLDPRNWKDDKFFIPFSQLDRNLSWIPSVVTAQAFADLPPFVKHLTSFYQSIRKIQDPVPYLIDPPNQYCKLMRNWGGLFVSDMIHDHYCRSTPRDFDTFAMMNPGDRYPEALMVAQQRYESARAAWMRSGGKRPKRSEYVPPYSIDGFPDKWRKLIPDQPSWTITAHLGKDTYSHIHYDSSQKRMITVREAARLQSFPDGFRFSGNTGDVLRQIGNAVPPLLAHAIGSSIYQQLASHDQVPAPERHSMTNLFQHSELESNHLSI